MRLTITRTSFGNVACIGILRMYNDEDRVIFKCYTLEEKDEGVKRGADLRIPSGSYNLKRHSPSRFEKTLRGLTGNNKDEMVCVYNDAVPADRCILIHWGNTPSDTEGCILLGVTKVTSGRIGESKRACKEFYQLLADVDVTKIKMEIK